MKLLEEHTSDEAPDATTTNVTSGPFKGLQTPHRSLKANASYVTSSLVDAYLITHPHLDHTSGFIMNTANFQSTGRPKKLAALPPTIEAFKTHIFNNVIWPNLSDENQGVGLITYMRLREGGSSAIGEGDSRGYVEIVDHLGVKAWSISHGHCVETHTHRGSNAGLSLPESGSPMLRPQSLPFMQNSPRSDSLMSGPSVQQIRAEIGGFCVYDSCAYFIRDLPTGKELLIFGDVEPDSVSLSPRNRHVWSEAAPMIISGRLAAIFIECSYNDSVTQDRLYGHLAPRYLIEELNVLAEEVETQRRLHDKDDKENKKRKRVNLVPPAASRRPPPTPISKYPCSRQIILVLRFLWNAMSLLFSYLRHLLYFFPAQNVEAASIR
ncbi:cAMP phosphodiesterases class-II-domain-containing protein [Bisporella sp. PMI_857]|nr:cAMP phosphodiesterases class-II-domain-containing protein [Bisporella sp. PMI_857]